MNLEDKLAILAESAKYDASCASSGSSRANTSGGIGSAATGGICHSWSDDGRCISLLKILQSNNCLYDCAFCVNRRSNDHARATLTPREVADLTINFYRRNYIEGLFLSSGVFRSPDYTMEQIYHSVRILRHKYRFNGYIHVKAIPGAAPELIRKTGYLVDRMSANIELPSQKSLSLMAPEKSKKAILTSMNQIDTGITEYRQERKAKKKAPSFVPAGQSTQLIVGATPEQDRTILTLSEALYDRLHLKRVYYSAFVPVRGSTPLVPVTSAPLKREHRLYQADWLLRFYHFTADELLDEDHPNLDPEIDPKTWWALTHREIFPVEINHAEYETLLRVPGIGVKSAKKILRARRTHSLGCEDMKRIGVVMKRARYFITCRGRAPVMRDLESWRIREALLDDRQRQMQLSLFTVDPALPDRETSMLTWTGEL